jgi:hypothetical protein
MLDLYDIGCIFAPGTMSKYKLKSFITIEILILNIYRGIEQ